MMLSTSLITCHKVKCNVSPEDMKILNFFFLFGDQENSMTSLGKQSDEFHIIKAYMRKDIF